MRNFTIIVDNGHGVNTKGKRSPDGVFREWEWNRKCAKEIINILSGASINHILLVPEDDDISLKERCRRINDVCEKEGPMNVILVSVHSNAFGDGKEFNSASGWSVWTSFGSTKADVIATSLYNKAVDMWGKERCRTQMIDGDPDYEDSFYILVHSLCPAVLIENFFYTNKSDYEYLLTEESIHECASVAVNGVIDFISKQK